MATQKERLAPALETEGLDEAAAAEPGRTSALAALEYRDFRLFWIGLVVSNIGTWMQQFGLGWLVVQLAIKDGVPHLAPFYLGLVGLSRAVPGLAFGLFGGAVADRADRRRLLLVTQTSAAIVAAILAALTISEHINIVEIVLLSAMHSIIFSFDAPTREGLSCIRGDPVLRWVVVLSVATALFTRPYIQLLPAEAQFLGVGALELSLLLAASGGGALVGALITASLGAWRRRGALLVG